MKREVAVTPHNHSITSFRTYYRERKFIFWSPWKVIVCGDRCCAFPYEAARKLADQALANGTVPCSYPYADSECYPVMELDEEIPE